MAKGAVSDVVHKRGDTEKFFDIVRRWDILDRFLEKRIQMACKAACHMHGAERVDEAGVFRRGVDPAGALELIDVPEALDPGGVDQILFRPFVGVRNGEGYGEGDILVNRIGDQRRPIIWSIEIDARIQTWRAKILAYILRGRQWFCLGEGVRLPIFGDKIVGEWIGECRTENAQDESAKNKRYGIGHDLFIDRAETYIVPVEGGAVRSAEHERADPVGGAEDGDQGPWIVEKGACHEREKVESHMPRRR